MPRLCVITGTKREAACLRSQLNSNEIDIACSGADALRAYELAEKALSEGCSAILSFGVSGGLDPGLASGTLVLADAVIAPDGGKFATDKHWRTAVAHDLAAAKIGFVTGTVVGVDQAISHPGPKQTLYEGTKALCVDMESHSVMRVARAHNVPWLVLRAIADSSSDVLPDIAMAAIDTQGDVRYGTLIARLLRRPSELIALLKLWRISGRAFASLRRVAFFPSLCRPF